MSQIGNNRQRILSIVGIAIFIASVGISFQNCGQAVKTTDPSVGIQNTPTPFPTITPTPTPGATPGPGIFTATNTAGAPTARCQHAAVSVGTQYFVWGGVTPNVTMPVDGGLFNPATNAWTAVSATGAPGPRNFATAVYTGSSVIVWGGLYTSNLNTGGIYTLATGAWTTVGTTGAPVGRFNHAAVWTGSKMIIYGGAVQNGATETYLNSGAIYDPALNTWTAMATGPTISGIASGTWTGSKFVVFGGAHANNGGIYDPTTNAWSALPTTGLPTARDAHVVFSNGSKVVVWGGYKQMNGQNFFDNSGAILDLATMIWSSTSTIGVPTGAVDRSIGFSGSRLIAYEPQLMNGGVLDISSNTWSPMNVNGGLASRFSHTSGAVGNTLVTWGGCVQNGATSQGFNTGTFYQ